MIATISLINILIVTKLMLVRQVNEEQNYALDR